MTQCDELYRRELGEVSGKALAKRDADRRRRDALDDVDEYFNAPTADEINRVIAEHQRGVDEVMRGRT